MRRPFFCEGVKREGVLEPPHPRILPNLFSENEEKTDEGDERGSEAFGAYTRANGTWLAYAVYTSFPKRATDR